jgi:hypothetical protein
MGTPNLELGSTLGRAVYIPPFAKARRMGHPSIVDSYTKLGPKAEALDSRKLKQRQEQILRLPAKDDN